MGTKKNRRPSEVELIVGEIDRRLEQSMTYNAGSFSESAARWHDAQYAALRSLRDWLTA